MQQCTKKPNPDYSRSVKGQGERKKKQKRHRRTKMNARLTMRFAVLRTDHSGFLYAAVQNAGAVR